MLPLTVVYDACVLYPAELRSFLMYLATAELFFARWSESIHEEWMRNIEKNRPDIDRQTLEKNQRQDERKSRWLPGHGT